MTHPNGLLYVQAESLLSKMTRREIFQLTTEQPGVGSATEAEAGKAIVLIDSVPLSEAPGTYSNVAIGIAEKVLEKLKWSESRVNSLAAKTYTVPLVASDGTVPPEVQDCVLAIARYKLFSRRPGVPEQVKEDYEENMAWLLMVNRGEASLNIMTADRQDERPEGHEVGESDLSNTIFGTVIF